jgi:hypothetical protein
VDVEALAPVDAAMLVQAFPVEAQPIAMVAAQHVADAFVQEQSTYRFAVRVQGQAVVIPQRLYLAPERLAVSASEEVWRFTRALQTRSCDGFERQGAARDLLDRLEPWSAPYIVALIGEYIVEILDDIFARLTPENAQMLAGFIGENPAYWSKTKRRVTSYWDAYYRYGRGGQRRDSYVGFRLVDRLDAIISERGADSAKR